MARFDALRPRCCTVGVERWERDVTIGVGAQLFAVCGAIKMLEREDLPKRNMARFIFALVVIGSMVALNLFVLVTQWSNLSGGQVKWLLFVGPFLWGYGFLHAISIPILQPSGLSIKYGPYIRFISSGRLKRVTYNERGNIYSIHADGMLLKYDISLKSFADQAGMESALKRWFKENDLLIEDITR